MSDVREMRLVLTVRDFDAALTLYRDALGLEAAGADRIAGPVTTPWNDRNVRLQTADGTQLTLFSTLE